MNLTPADYERQLRTELMFFKKKLKKRSSPLQQLSKKAQNKVNDWIPEKAHHVITESIKKMVQATLAGSNITTKNRDVAGLTLQEKEKLIMEKLNTYKKTAAVEGAGTGAGGIISGLADFPLLLSIKMKFLFDVASIYGFDVKAYEERLFLLYIFQLAFSSDEHRRSIFKTIEQWEVKKEELKDMNWREFQQEYRDYIDFVKMLQLLPGVGAAVGAYANYRLLDQLGEAAMNAFRMRLLDPSPN